MGRKEKVSFYKKDETKLNTIILENITSWSEINEPVLLHVDFELPVDQTVIVQSTNPLHAVQFLKILAGRQFPESGRVLLNDNDQIDLMYNDENYNKLLSCYFENERSVDQAASVFSLLSTVETAKDQVWETLEHFGLTSLAQKTFHELNYENQKLILLLRATKDNPEMLILEDPASGLSESKFLDFLDYIQFLQRRGTLRHIFLTNCHPTADKHWHESIHLLIEDGLIYQEELLEAKKAVHF